MKLAYSIRDLDAEGICKKTKAYDLIREGKLVKVKVGGKTLVTGESVRELLSVA